MICMKKKSYIHTTLHCSTEKSKLLASFFATFEKKICFITSDKMIYKTSMYYISRNMWENYNYIVYAVIT